MAVNTHLALPAQPASGVVHERVYGGRGLISPKCAADVQLIIASDASGGANAVEIQMDPRYSCLVAYCAIAVAGAAAAIPYRLNLIADAGGVYGPSIDASTGTFNANWAPRACWTPPPYLMSTPRKNAPFGEPAALGSTIPNTNGEMLDVTRGMYCFRKEVDLKAPLTQIFQVLQRGATAAYAAEKESPRCLRRQSRVFHQKDASFSVPKAEYGAFGRRAACGRRVAAD